MKTIAWFYQNTSIKNEEFRLYLDIIKESSQQKIFPELYLIMQNPGSCANTEKNYNKEVLIRPDATTHRVIGLLNALERLNYIRILNLSDLVNPKGIDFFSKLPIIEKKISKSHTLFDNSRRTELDNLMKDESLVYFACGVNKKIENLKFSALEVLKEKRIKILNGKFEFYHPLTRPNKKLIKGWKFQAAKDLNHLFSYSLRE